MKCLLILIVSMAIAGCTAYVIDDDRISDSISVWRVSCDKPYELVRDCSNAWGPTRKTVIDDSSFDLAGNIDGNVLLMALTSGGLNGTQITEGFLLGATDQSGPLLEVAFLKADRVLKKEGILITNIVPIIAPDWLIHFGKIGDTYGYILELDGNGYSVLEKFAVEESLHEEPNQSAQTDQPSAGS